MAHAVNPRSQADFHMATELLFCFPYADSVEPSVIARPEDLVPTTPLDAAGSSERGLQERSPLTIPSIHRLQRPDLSYCLWIIKFIVRGWTPGCQSWANYQSLAASALRRQGLVLFRRTVCRANILLFWHVGDHPELKHLLVTPHYLHRGKRWIVHRSQERRKDSYQLPSSAVSDRRSCCLTAAVRVHCILLTQQRFLLKLLPELLFRKCILKKWPMSKDCRRPVRSL